MAIHLRSADELDKMHEHYEPIRQEALSRVPRPWFKRVLGIGKKQPSRV